MQTRTRLTFLSPALLSLVAIVATPASAQSQSYSVTTGSRTFSSIASFGTPLGLTGADDSFGSITLPFDFSLFGSVVPAFSTIYASTNGLLTFYNSSTSYSNTFIPSSGTPEAFITGFWADLEGGASGDIYYYAQGSGTSASLTIEWYYAESHADPAQFFNFQVILYGNGNVELAYGPRATSPTISGSVGIEDATGVYGSAPACNSACTWTSDLLSGTLLTFVPGVGPPPGVDLQVGSLVSFPPTTWSEGSQVSFTASMYNAGTSAAAGSYAGIFIGSSPTVTLSDYRIPNADVYVSSVGAGLSSSVFFSFLVPTGFTGSWYYAVIADSYNDVIETSESNNVYQGGTVTITGGSSTVINITTTSLPNANLGISYSAQLQQSGGVSPSWLLTSGNLPQGMTLSSSGLISGIPSVAGTATFSVSCSESGRTPGNQTLSLTVTNGSSGLVITPATIPAATVGVPYNVMLTGMGGIQPYGFQIISGAPAWLTLTGQGVLSGTPLEAGNAQFTVSLIDSNLMNATQVYDLVVTAPTALALVAEVPAAVKMRPFSAPVVQGGIPPYTITITSGTLPTGLTFNAQGQLTGTPIAVANTTVNISVTDSNTPQGMVAGPVLVRVSELSLLAITTEDLVVYVKTDASADLQASGGVPPYRWALLEGTLQTGLLFDPENGRVTGRVEVTGTTTATVAVTDSEGSRAEKRIQIKAQIFRSANGGDNSNNRSGGCDCSAGPTSGRESAWAGLVLLGLLARRRRR